MSAIYGIINLDGKPLKKDSFLKMEQEYRDFKIDKFSSFLYENVAFGTGLQFITKQSQNEVLPFIDKRNNNLFTADCYLDNRKELIPLLAEEGQSIGISVDDKIPDGMLIYLSYLKWGQKLCDHLLGVFAIAVYNYNNKSFHLYVDHCGDRCIHYYLRNNTLYFSTTIIPIQAATDSAISISEKFIAACESNLSADMVLFPGMTPFVNVYQLLAGQHLIADFTNEKCTLKIEQYWDPVKTVKPIKLKNDDEYKELFLKTYSKCITDALNVDGKIGCFLSSGLDSSSVASMAALYLKDKGETLHSYTSVPTKDYQGHNTQRLEDESIPVQKFCDHFGNILPTFLSCEGKSALTELERFVKLFNSPIKYSVNSVWMDEIYKKASMDGCKVLLKGQHGNASVSYGGLIIRMWDEFKHLHFIQMIKQYKLFSKGLHVNRKAFVKSFISEIASIFHHEIPLESSLTKKELLDRYNLSNVYIQRNKWYGGENIHSEIQRRRSLYMPASFQQVSFANAHFELKYGLIARDPTRDKRIIELCMAMPIKCFADGVYERRLITYYMKDILPNHIHRQMYQRGLQSADYMQRIAQFPSEKSKFILLFSEKKLDAFLDRDKLNKLDFNSQDSLNTIASLNVLSLYYFLNKNSKIDYKKPTDL